jgi:hypothetical protein
MGYARGAAIALIPVFLATAPVQAQTDRFYLGGGVIADRDMTNSALSDATLTSWTIVFGGDASSHFGIRGIFEAPHETSTFGEGIYTRPPSATPVHERYTYTRRTMTYGVLGDVHGQLTPAVRLAGTFGFVTVTHDSTMVIVRHAIRPDGSREPMSDLRTDGDHDWMGVTFGVEVSLRFVRRLEVVPEVRVIAFAPSDSPSPYIVRSGVGMRWRF